MNNTNQQKSSFKKHWMWITLPAVFVLIIAAGLRHNDFEISKNLEIFATIFRQLNSNYAEDINPGKLTKTAIDAMLASLDPFTVYMPEADIEDYRMTQAGHSGSVGLIVEVRNGKHIIVAINNNGDAANKGLLIGDEITAVDQKPIKGKTADEVNQLLSGQAGTQVAATIKQAVTGIVKDYSLERKVIKEQTVPWTGMPVDNIAYINLRTFSQTASAEVKEALLKLTSQNEVTGLILDLRGNGGGLLIEAVNIANLFVKKNEIIVSTRGRIPDRNKIYRTYTSPVDMKLPIVVLMDERSASASEIVAGALQDLDRAVVIGQQSYGKGLVQNVVPLIFNAQLKVTIAKYYIPSGRCIQAIEYFDNPDSKEGANDQSKNFKTRNGRAVIDGKGILPDIDIHKPSQSPVVKSLVNNYFIFDFATEYRQQNQTADAPESFKITDKIWKQFVNFVEAKNYVYRSDAEDRFTEFIKTLDAEGYGELLKKETGLVKNSLKEAKKSDLERHRGEIERLLKKELIYRYYFDEGLIKMGLAEDQEMKEAFRILENNKLYHEIIAGGYNPL